MTHFSFQNNNFDLIRLLAALQVAWMHAAHHLGTGGPDSLNIFPGVPIFFVVSGFLVSASLERSNLYEYGVKRALRIFPALWVCFGAGVLSVALFGDINTPWPEFLVWAGAQLSFAQFYNPDFLRDYGVGVLNGSLWTIPVELQFYMMLPLIYLALSKIKQRTLVMLALIALFSAFNQVFLYFKGIEETLEVKLLGVTVFPYLNMFLLGMLLQRNLIFVSRCLAGKFIFWLLLYLASCIVFNTLGWEITGNAINPVSAALLGLAVVSAAYTRPNLKKLLAGNDISYGLYIYHMIVVNVLVSMGYRGDFVVVAVLISMGLAYLSWVLVERPALGLKHRLISPSVIPHPSL